MLDGIIVIDKPGGVSSHGVVAAVRRLLPGLKVGHTGTLDPMATGVLPLCVGRATRVAEYITALPKCYRAAVALGVTTDTGDATGTVTARKPVPGLDREELEKMVGGFRGSIEQFPPLYSAVKFRGRPLYRWAREGERVPLRKRVVEIYAIRLTGFEPGGDNPRFTIKLCCSKGTYVRSLAVDMGEALKCGAHLSALRRTAVGPFEVNMALTLDQFAEACGEGFYPELLRPMDEALGYMPALALSDEAINDLRHGRQVLAESSLLFGPLHPGEELARAYDPAGSFRALVRFEVSGSTLRLKTEKYLSRY